SKFRNAGFSVPARRSPKPGLHCRSNLPMRARLPALLLLALPLLFWLELGSGPAAISPWQGFTDLFAGRDSAAALILLEVRLPRALLALLVGASLALSGAALQGLLRNPLASPDILGISQSAVLP